MGDEKGLEVKGFDEEALAGEGTISLKSQDDQSFSLPRKVACGSNLVKTILESDKEATECKMENVRGEVLRRIVDYLNHHAGNPAKEIERPLKTNNIRDVVEEWDADFVEIEQDLLFEVILAANYMDIKPLLDLTCAKVATMLKGKSPEEIRKKFNIQNDFTPEEEEAVRAENKWAEDS